MEETMDSLWFFSNVFFSSRATILGPIEPVEEAVKEECSKPMSPIAQNQQKNSPPEAQMLVPLCPKCEEPESLKLDMEVVEYYYSPSPRSTEKEKSRRRRRSKRSVQQQRHRRKILGELDELGLDDYVKENNTMPSISDNMAMKEHLKSWAYAVACTVR
ncbi:PREDICTED: POPTR_0004s05840g [Prunus dulcis]|uniref:PREDICTED: POPTR_0004s05840g n=1 Tax=Prunus dulcis TaxID=3755 RepID=A0A5E4G679_PRUDU|nr:PREDICTED: POPTR_0004s05840g [Prunus dulcis]